MGTRVDGITLVDDVGGSGPSTPVNITAPIGPNLAANSVSVTLATDENPIEVQIVLPLGQDVAANSIPVVLASNQPSIDVITDIPTDIHNTTLPSPLRAVVVGGGNLTQDQFFMLPVMANNWDRPTINNQAVSVVQRNGLETAGDVTKLDDFISTGGKLNDATTAKKLLFSQNELTANPADGAGVVTREYGQQFRSSGSISVLNQRFTISNQVVVKSSAIFDLDATGFTGTLRPVVSTDNGATWKFTNAFNIETGIAASSFVNGDVTGAFTIPFGSGATNYGFEITAVTTGGVVCKVSANSVGVSSLFTVSTIIGEVDIRDLKFATDKVDVSGSDVSNTELPTPAALVDNTPNPTISQIATFPHLFDGATWDRARGTSTDGALVNLGTNNDVTPAINLAQSFGSINFRGDSVSILSPDGYNSIGFRLNSSAGFTGTVAFGYTGTNFSAFVYDATHGKWISEISLVNLDFNNGFLFIAPLMPGLQFSIICTVYVNGILTVDSIESSLSNLIGAPLTNQDLRSAPVEIGALVSEVPASYIPDTIKSLSLTSEGRVRVSSVDANFDKVWASYTDNPWNLPPTVDSISPWN